MRAIPGDKLMVKERRTGEGDREAVVIEVWSESGRPPMWSAGMTAARTCSSPHPPTR
jgi:hypothetical protein